MRFNLPFDFSKDRRKYPIQRDDVGQSLRQRCFELFRQGKNAREAGVILQMKLPTARRYFPQWNGCPPALEATYKYLRNELKTKRELSPGIIGMFGAALGLPEWEIVNMLSRPHGLKRLIMGELVRQRKRQLFHTQEQRLEAALHLVVDLERTGVPLEWIHREIKKLLQRALRYADAHKGEDQGEATENDIQIP